MVAKIRQNADHLKRAMNKKTKAIPVLAIAIDWVY